MKVAIKPLLLLISVLSFSGAAVAVERADSAGNTSGPAVGTPVEPSTVVQKANPHVGGRPSRQSEAAAGAPGIEAAPGTEAGTVAGRAPSNRR